MHVDSGGEGLPELAEGNALAPGTIDDLRRDGHVKLRAIFSREEIDAYRPRLARVVERHGADSHAMERKVAGNAKGWRFVNNLWAQDDAARRFVLNRRLGRIAAELLGVEAVRVFRDQSYFKDAGGGSTPWHQDSRFMPLDTDDILTLWIPLTDITPDMAPMSYVTGSHKAGYLGTSQGDDESMDRFEEEMREKGLRISSYGSFEAGDVAAHMASTLHSSRTNASRRLREVVVIVYFADGARVSAETPLPPGAPAPEFYANIIQRQNRETSLPGCRPGDLAAGPMTPLVYRAPS
ncbi:phytanoyl-CoA dioxygenase family protein [Sorangium sp. So ce1182]|uniref:phytanoyl-CoA dioxygenase family protein n=1 Tax=Sorangium sp. So ce1182 TaxID=3133334 RepID=UPI003F6078FC